MGFSEFIGFGDVFGQYHLPLHKRIETVFEIDFIKEMME